MINATLYAVFSTQTQRGAELLPLHEKLGSNVEGALPRYVKVKGEAEV